MPFTYNSIVGCALLTTALSFYAVSCLNMCIELKVFIVLVSGSSVLSFVPVVHFSIPHCHIVSLVFPLIS